MKSYVVIITQSLPGESNEIQYTFMEKYENANIFGKLITGVPIIRGLVKEEYLVINLGKFSRCGYSLEAPCQSTFNESHNFLFYGEVGKFVPELSPITPP